MTSQIAEKSGGSGKTAAFFLVFPGISRPP